MPVLSTTWHAGTLIPIGAAVLVVIVGSWLSARFLHHQEQHLQRRYRGDFASAKTRFELVRRLTVAVVVVIGLLAAAVSVPQTQAFAQTLLASSAVLALIAGLALRTPLANIAAGLQLAFTQPFRLGDRICVAERTGVVEEIKLSYTVLRTDDGRRAFLPNDQVIGSPIMNATIEDPARAETVTVPVTHDADLARVRIMLLEVAEQVEGRVASPLPAVRVAAVDTTAITMAITAWVEDGAAAARVASALREAAVLRLREAGALAHA